MNINEAFPSNYLKAHDLQGRNVTVTMDRIEFEKIGTDDKVVLYFQGKDKGLVLNKTNAKNIENAYGPETEHWRGQPITLFEAMVDFRGETVAAIRVRKPQPKDNPQQQPVQQQRRAGGMSQVATDNAGALDDEIPF